MNAPVAMFVAWAAFTIGPALGRPSVQAGFDDSYLTWTAAKAKEIGRSTRVEGHVAGTFVRVRSTTTFRATWMTGDVIRATARLALLADRLCIAQTNALVQDAEAAGEITIMVELDSNEGSGVIPLDWVALLGPRTFVAGETEVARGKSVPALREVRALSGVFGRDYNYDVFWIVFSLDAQSGKPLFPAGVREAELIVRIYSKEGRARWRLPDSIKRRLVASVHTTQPRSGSGTDTRSR